MLPVRGPQGADRFLTITVPTARIRDVMAPVAPPGWTIGVGDREGNYVARSPGHEQATGRPGLPEYLQKVVGREGTFTARNFQGETLLAGYYRSPFSGWFYAANVPLAVAQAPLWRSLLAVGALGAVAMLLSGALAYAVGGRFAKAAAGLANRAEALGEGRPVAPMATAVSEFGVIAGALLAAERAIAERAQEMDVVLATVPAAVWFTYDPLARQVIRNRFAAELMGVPEGHRRSHGAPDLVIDTVALKDGRRVAREDRPLSRAMRGEETDNEEFAYILLDGAKRTLLTSARPIRSAAGGIIGAVQISLDISERKRAEEQRELLVHELNHRVKNTLAVVQAVAAQTLRSAGSLPAAGQALTERLALLARAHDVLTQENWSGADLDDLVKASLAPHAGLDRFRLEGGPVRLKPSLALALSLALHELATNAIKYGALSGTEGTVSIAWSVEEEGPERRLAIEWREEDGPSVQPSDRRGFGTRMLERLLGPEGGSVTLAFEPEGVVCILQAALGGRAGEDAAA